MHESSALKNYPRVWRVLLLASLNPHISFLHSFQEQKPTLAFDLIEEFRSQVVDRAILSMLTRKATALFGAAIEAFNGPDIFKLFENRSNGVLSL